MVAPNPPPVSHPLLTQHFRQAIALCTPTPTPASSERLPRCQAQPQQLRPLPQGLSRTSPSTRTHRHVEQQQSTTPQLLSTPKEGGIGNSPPRLRRHKAALSLHAHAAHTRTLQALGTFAPPSLFAMCVSPPTLLDPAAAPAAPSLHTHHCCPPRHVTPSLPHTQGSKGLHTHRLTTLQPHRQPEPCSAAPAMLRVQTPQ